ncbi:MAG: calcium/sodium antiporter [Actinomycetota bacterium]
MAIDFPLLVVGLALLVWSADQFVLGASRLATLVSLPPIVIGAVVMGFGTSAPEMLVSALAAAGGDRDLGVGNIIGSNVANLSLVLGTAGIVATMSIPKSVITREGPLAIASSLLLSAFILDGSIARWQGAVLVVVLVVVIVYLIKSGQADVADVIDTTDPAEMSSPREIGRTVVGLVGTVGGAQLVVWSATDIAEEFGVSGGLIGFTLVALGTSLPELVTTVASARRGETDLIVGNLFGSNIFNALAVGGALGLVGPGSIDDPSLTDWGIAIMMIVTLGAFAMAIVGRNLNRIEGIVLVAAYVGATALLASLAADPDELEDDASSTPVEIDATTGPAALEPPI